MYTVISWPPNLLKDSAMTDDHSTVITARGKERVASMTADRANGLAVMSGERKRDKIAL